jgi:hypothetical protein
MSRAKSGGGIRGNFVSNVNAPKQEPRPHAVSVGSVSRLGAVVGEGTPYKGLYAGKGYSTPVGPTDGMDARPGGNGRQIMRAGSQAHHGPDRPMGPGRSLFK